MREIKFRVWSGDMWLDGGDALFHVKDKDSTNLELVAGHPLKEYIICQFTGLKDKNGREIYEGDILDVKAGESGVFRYQVTWNEKQCGWRNQYGQKLPQLFGKPNSEVVGNIYENLELLKK